ncbi:MAG TPA: DUF3352 domain-containing protein [Solirubrobacteraceae bacterium]|nr:DUF3352 domain-containing protein [Solirubrobacteraceae bacterium]
MAGLLCAAAVASLAGCGSSHKATSADDPSRLTPASAALYAGAVVRPEGELKSAAQAAGQALTHQADPYTRLLELLRTPGSPPLDYASEVAPWLGPQAATFATSLQGASALVAPLEQLLLGASPTTGAFPFSANGLQGAILLSTTDAGKAGAFLHTRARLAGAHATSYRGVAFEANSGGVAFGLVDDFAVIGSLAGMQGVIDTSLGDPALAHSASYERLLSVAPSSALAHVYSNPSALVGGASSGPSAPAGLLAVLAGARAVNVSLVPSASSIALDADALTQAKAAPAAGGLLESSAQGAQALDELPGDSWLAIGLGNVGPSLTGDVRGLTAALGALGGGSGESQGISIKGLLEGIIAPLKVLGGQGNEARRAYQSWMGSAGIFASGTGLVELRAAVTINSNDPALSRAAVAKVGEALEAKGGSVGPTSIPGTDAAIQVRVPGLPVELAIANGKAANGQTKFVIGLAEASVTAALRPASTLSSAATRSNASAMLGEGIQPSVIINFQTLLSLLEGFGLNEDPAISRFLPLMRASTTLAGGAKQLDGEVQRLRLVLGLAPAG